MLNTTKTTVSKTTATAADKATALATRKATALAKQSATPATPAEQTAPKNTHIGTVSTSNYSGLSGYLNTGAKPAAINLAGYFGKAPGSLSIRSLGLLSAMRTAYGTKAFPARGFDIGILSMLAGTVTRDEQTNKPVSNPLIKLTGGAIADDKNGVPRLTDMPGNPVLVTVTPFGQTFGQALKAKAKPKAK
jgi:hypothetical protein